MGTELVGQCVKEDNMEIPSIPPGFESLAPFTLKRIEDNQASSYVSPVRASELQTVKLKTTPLRRKLWMNSSSDELESEQIDLQMFLQNALPKGVAHGCEACSNCQKVAGKWRPEEARRPDLEEVPVFYPSEEEFQDTLKYISSIRAKAEIYGICRIVPPTSWKPPCPLEERNTWERSKFTTRIQRIDKLQNRYSTRKILQVNDNKKTKKRRYMKNGVDHGNSNDEIKIQDGVGLNEADRFGFVLGPEFTLEAFQMYADDFKTQYFRNSDNGSDSEGDRTMLEEPLIECIEGEYWRIVEKPTEEIEVLYGADLETGVFGSGFPKNSQQVASDSDLKYISSGWNLNNFPRLPGSVLSFESSDISGVLVPWLYIGMCFSSFCWHVEDHHLYSLNYMHWGAPKMWYGVPGSDALKLEAAMRKHLPDLFEEQPDLLHKLVTQLSPSILRCEGVPVYRCLQKPGEFVLTFPRAYHAGFNCGFNCAEAVNVAPVDWLPHGQNAIDLYREQGRKTSISHDKLLLGAAREAVKANWEFNLLKKHTSNNLSWKDVCGKDGILSKALKIRVEKERARREFLCKSSQALKMESSFDAHSERECNICFFDLHLSAAGCHHCSPVKYACLNHAKQLCSCSWGAKFFLFRYDINELSILVEALEGKLSATYRWARLDLGLSLSSYVSKDKKQIPKLTSKLSHTSQELALKMSSLPASSTSKEQADGDIQISTNTGQNLKPPVVVLALKSTKTTFKISSQKIEATKKNSPCKKQKSSKLALRLDTPSEADSLKTPPAENLDLKKPENEFSVKIEISEKHTCNTQKPTCPDNMASLGFCITNLEPTTIISGHLIKFEDHGEAETCSKPHCDEVNKDARFKRQRLCDEKSNYHKMLESDVDSILMGGAKTVSCSSSGFQNNLDKFYRQKKGPRIAKVVRRISCNVEPLKFGVVRAGNSWCDSRAIYPSGFRSRMKYIDILDPANMCYYISEILDVRSDGPLFMVYVEHTPSEVFVHVSATRCWEMVRDRVNQEIGKRHKLGRVRLPPLQPPGSLDGIEMFGFSSPAIVQAIQAMDQNRVCTEYWISRPLIQQIPQQPQSVDSGSNSSVKSKPLHDHETGKNHHEVETILNGLFNKANPVELHTLYSLLSDKNSSNEQSILTRILNMTICKDTS